MADYAESFDASLISASDASLVVEEAAAIEKMAAAVCALAAGRVAATSVWRRGGDRSAAHHLARKTGKSVSDAVDALRTAKRLEDLPEVCAAARRGDLSSRQASAIADAASVDPVAQSELVKAAATSSLGELRENCARTKASATRDSESRRRRIHDRRCLRQFCDSEGAFNLHFRDNPEVGAEIMSIIGPLADRILASARREGRVEPAEAHAADALLALARRCGSRSAPVEQPSPAQDRPGHAGEPDSDGCAREVRPGASDPDDADHGKGADNASDDDSRLAAARRAVAAMKSRVRGEDEAGVGGNSESSVRSSGDWLGGDDGSCGPPDPRSPTSPGLAKLIVRVDLPALLRGYPTSGEVCEISGYGPVAVSAVTDMIDSGDPFLVAVATDADQVLGVAHLRRRPNARQQSALEWIYPSCAVEGCSASVRLENDHRANWADTHFTLVDLLDRLCSHHHGLKTIQGWALIEGRGKRAIVGPDDPRHPAHGSSMLADDVDHTHDPIGPTAA